MSTHTPAPWRHDHYGIRDRGGYICELRWPQHYKDQDERFQRETSERQFDARLISAAPELLAALKGLLADITEYQTLNKLGGENNHWQVIARAAIAKAVGIEEQFDGGLKK